MRVCWAWHEAALSNDPSATISPQNGRALTFLGLKSFDNAGYIAILAISNLSHPPNYENVTLAYLSEPSVAILVSLG
jgi:hypothetical protein